MLSVLSNWRCSRRAILRAMDRDGMEYVLGHQRNVYHRHEHVPGWWFSADRRGRFEHRLAAGSVRR
jgi:hypothetical protein